VGKFPLAVFKEKNGGLRPYDLKYISAAVPDGDILGGAYALIAIGYTLVYGILRLINFAHGDIFMMAGYFMIFSMAVFPWYVSIPLVLVATTLLGVGIEKVAYKPLTQRSPYERHDFRHRCFLSSAEPCHLSFHRTSEGLSGNPGLKENLSDRRLKPLPS
jgi:ABC-type branched-subunit amino acid transport system permease subunit